MFRNSRLSHIFWNFKVFWLYVYPLIVYSLGETVQRPGSTFFLSNGIRVLGDSVTLHPLNSPSEENFVSYYFNANEIGCHRLWGYSDNKGTWFVHSYITGAPIMWRLRSGWNVSPCLFDVRKRGPVYVVLSPQSRNAISRFYFGPCSSKPHCMYLLRILTSLNFKN